MHVLYSLVIIFSTSLGAIAGLGGGIIIKPLLDLIGLHDATEIGMYACLAVFTMCVVSLTKQARAGISFDRGVVLPISLGSLAGGVVGEHAFGAMTLSLNGSIVKGTQALILAVTLVLILVYTLTQDSMPRFRITSFAAIFAAGLSLGAISVFLGIGGGPLNVACMSLLFSFDMKQSVVLSLATIFFSQLSKLAAGAITGTLFLIDPLYALAVVGPAVVGGHIGTALRQKMSSEAVRRVYLAIMVALLTISVLNAWRALGQLGRV